MRHLVFLGCVALLVLGLCLPSSEAKASSDIDCDAYGKDSFCQHMCDFCAATPCDDASYSCKVVEGKYRSSCECSGAGVSTLSVAAAAFLAVVAFLRLRE